MVVTCSLISFKRGLCSCLISFSKSSVLFSMVSSFCSSFLSSSSAPNTRSGKHIINGIRAENTAFIRQKKFTPIQPPMNMIIIFNIASKKGGPSITALFARAEIVELPLHFKGLEPVPDAGLPVRMPAKFSLFKGTVYPVYHLIFSCAKHLHIVAVMRTVIGHHRHHMSLYFLVCVKFYNGVVYAQVRHPLPCCKAIGVILCCPYVALQMDIRFSPRFHNPLWLHLDGLKIYRCYFHAIQGLRQAYGCLQGHSLCIEQNHNC